LLLPGRLLTPGGPVELDAAWHAHAAALLAPLAPVTRAMIGSDVALASPAAKAALFARTGAAAVDMESHVLAQAGSGLPLLILRAVADTAADALPPAALVAVRPDGSTDLAAVLGAVLRRPAQVPALMRLGKAAAKGEAGLRQAISMLSPLVP
jgi:hypothetical protein